MPDPDHPEGDRAPAEPPITPPPRSDAAGMSTAMKRADQQAEPIAAVERALNSTAPTKPTFIAHSHSLDAMLAAQEIALREHGAEIDRKIAELNAERDDLMLAFSMVQGARTAKQKALT